MSQLLGICFTFKTNICWRWNIPLFVGWCLIGTFTPVQTYTLPWNPWGWSRPRSVTFEDEKREGAVTAVAGIYHDDPKWLSISLFLCWAEWPHIPSGNITIENPPFLMGQSTKWQFSMVFLVCLPEGNPEEWLHGPRSKMPRIRPQSTVECQTQQRCVFFAGEESQRLDQNPMDSAQFLRLVTGANSWVMF